jgi:hypothetical protein
VCVGNPNDDSKNQSVARINPFACAEYPCGLLSCYQALCDGAGHSSSHCPRFFDLTQKLLPAIPFMKVAMRDDWIIYAVFGVLVCLLLWRVATQRDGNQRASLLILGVVALVMVAWQSVRLPLEQ